MKRVVSTLAIWASALLWLGAPCAQAESFGLKDLSATFSADEGGSPAIQAGSHPFAQSVSFDLNTETVGGGEVPAGALKDVRVELPPGFTGDPLAVPRCSNADFLTVPSPSLATACPDSAAIGVAATRLPLSETSAIYNLAPPPGVAARIGFKASLAKVPFTIDLVVNPEPPYNLIAEPKDVPQPVRVFGSTVTVWGNPADPVHDPFRGNCLTGVGGGSRGNCPSGLANRPFLLMPRSCTGPLTTTLSSDSWQEPGVFVGPYELESPAMSGCAKLGFGPSISAKPTSQAASSPTGLDFGLDVQDEGIGTPEGLALSDLKKAVVTLPAGMSVNPSQAEGLSVCTEADLSRETASSQPGEGCPQASKIGTVEVETPLLEGEILRGALFVAQPYTNRFGSLLALYMTVKDPKLGISLALAGKVEPDPKTGQLTTTFNDLPQQPFSHFRLHFREGGRSPLVTPPACGEYTTKAVLTPWANPTTPYTTTSAFKVISGPDNGPCPSGGLPPFHPGLIAGTTNNAAGRFSPFDVRLFRTDAEQEITRFSIKLPPGIVGKLAGIPFCSDAQIAAAKARSGPHGGQEEFGAPSCPAASQIGRSLAGSGVGGELTYVPGKVYLAGPYHGSAISIVAITAAVAGPFDLGTVVVREALKVNPETGEVFIDATGSDPIPHIIQGIPVHLRDIRVYTDRPEFVLNPTSCERTSTASTLLGAGLDFASEADDRPVTVSTPFQAADCAALPFKPKLTLKLVGGTKRGAHPALHAHLAMNGLGEAGVAFSQVTLPHSEFIENAHFKTICTRAQFKEGNGNGERCPAGSIYGHAKAVTPILSEPLEGPIFLRSSEHQLPDLVAALHAAEINVDLVGKVDSVNGDLRNTFETVPDAPVTSADFSFEGKSKGLFVNSTNLCKGAHRAKVDFTGHNGKVYDTKPALQVKCPKGHGGQKGHKGRR